MTTHTERITKEEAISLYSTPAALAKALGIQRQAVNGWEQGKPIPERQYLKLRYELKPERFTLAGKLKKGRN